MIKEFDIANVHNIPMPNEINQYAKERQKHFLRTIAIVIHHIRSRIVIRQLQKPLQVIYQLSKLSSGSNKFQI